MRYWLFKTEPQVYSVTDLAAAPEQTGVWDGIRNFQARNFLRDEAAIGDRVFIYHCQCAVPGIYGIARICRSAYPDPAQFNPQSPYYDAKAKSDQPRWVCVDIQLEQHLAKPLAVKVIKQQSALASLGIFKQPRLSVVPVTQQESDHLLALLHINA